MKPSTRILRIVAPENGGPRQRTVLDGLAVHYGADGKVVDELIENGVLVKYSDKRHARWGLPQAAGGRQRGFGTLVYLIAAVAVIGALWGLYAAVDGRGYKRGAAEKQAEWDQANRKAEAEALARRLAVAKELKRAEEARAAAEQKARSNEDKWKEALRENRRKGVQLATCGSPRPTTAAGAPVAPAGGSPDTGGVRFTWGFVRLYDGAWTGAGGEPLFGAPAGPAAAAGPGAAASPDAAGSAAPYGPDDLIEIHGENAARASSCRRDYNALIGKIKASESAWEKRSTSPP